MGLRCAAAAAAPAGKCACMGFCGENLSEVMGDVRSVLPECTLARQSWQFFVVILNSLQINALPMKKDC